MKYIYKTAYNYFIANSWINKYLNPLGRSDIVNTKAYNLFSKMFTIKGNNTKRWKVRLKNS